MAESSRGSRESQRGVSGCSARGRSDSHTLRNSRSQCQRRRLRGHAARQSCDRYCHCACKRIDCSRCDAHRRTSRTSHERQRWERNRQCEIRRRCSNGRRDSRRMAQRSRCPHQSQRSAPRRSTRGRCDSHTLRRSRSQSKRRRLRAHTCGQSRNRDRHSSCKAVGRCGVHADRLSRSTRNKRDTCRRRSNGKVRGRGCRLVTATARHQDKTEKQPGTPNQSPEKSHVTPGDRPCKNLHQPGYARQPHRTDITLQVIAQLSKSCLESVKCAAMFQTSNSCV